MSFFAPRPPGGNCGQYCVVFANHFVIRSRRMEFHNIYEDEECYQTILFGTKEKIVQKSMQALEKALEDYIAIGNGLESSRRYHHHVHLTQMGFTLVIDVALMSCESSYVREGYISDIALCKNLLGKNLLQELRIDVNRRLTCILEARVLQPPMLKYHDSGKVVTVKPCEGQWNTNETRMFSGGSIDRWACVDFSSSSPLDIVSPFVHRVVEMCNSKGMNFYPTPVVPFRSTCSDEVEATLVDIYNESNGRLQFLIVILPQFGSYETIKRVCETELGILSQCCQKKHAQNASYQYLENLALKINVKAGGRNTVLLDALLRKLPMVSLKPTIIFGAHVIHPRPGEKSSPSIAAVVASMDWPEFTKYRSQVSAQSHQQELIQDLYGMVRESLIHFRRLVDYIPQQIIFYRGGVSEGQFARVPCLEMDAIRKACSSLAEGYLPRVTFVVVQKRHNTRLFPPRHVNLMDKSGNILPGTVVDTNICHPVRVLAGLHSIMFCSTRINFPQMTFKPLQTIYVTRMRGAHGLYLLFPLLFMLV